MRPGTHLRMPQRRFTTLPVYDQVNFSPAQMAPKAWWDASDTTTITESSGAVSQWNDKSGNGYNLTQSTGAAQPTTNSVTKNGLNVLKFDGGDVMNYSGTTGMDVGNATVVGVFEETTTVTNAGFFAAYASTGNDFNSTSALLLESGTSSILFYTVRNSANAAVSGSGVTPFAVWTSVLTSGTLVARRNQQAIAVSTATGTWGTANGGFLVGGRWSSGAISATNRLNGNVAEIIVFDRELNFPEYDFLNRYLMTKWGITPT